MSEALFQAAVDAVVRGDAKKAEELARQGLAEGIEPLVLINQAFVPGINQVGEMFGSGKLFLPELIMSAKAMQAATDIINAAIPEGNAQEGRGRFVIGTVEGDVHDIGKTIVVALLKANGFEVLDLGRDVPTDRLIEEADKFNAHIIGTSALLTTTMPAQQKLEEALKKAGLKGRFKTMVGGAPVTERWAKKIGADGFAEDAGAAVTVAKQLLAGA
ncbi:MAG: corrinoid protein [Desulfacinum sp.]|nr:corrinoid protein [Desulfacinum sp.]